ncbi:hypothetical protein [Pseudonocardia sp. Ae706_Ps2]|uniref:hypothetical protein n=1 Tax=unclassified Pseudonocardia TaxID=2619320 RepID=UPI00352A2A5D
MKNTGGHVTDIAVMARLFLDPGHRGAGLAGFLILALRHHAQLIGWTVVVMAKDAAAVGFYDRSGAERSAEVTHRSGDGLTEPALVYIFPGPARRRLIASSATSGNMPRLPSAQVRRLWSVLLCKLHMHGCD